MPLADDFDVSQLKEDGNFLVELPANTWVMDNHKWALPVWEQHRQRVGGKRYSLIHADFHWDAVDEFANDVQAQAALMRASVDELHGMTEEGDFISYDSFIAPAVRRGLFSEVHFYCLQTDSEPLDSSLCDEFSARQAIYADVTSLAAVMPASPLIFDLCLDLFNRSDHYYQGDLWTDDQVLAFLEAVKHHVVAAELVTVSLSFGCSGTEEDTRHLAELVVRRLVKWRQ